MPKGRVARIDTDIEFSRRPEVIQYITQKYGAGNVCRIVTFGTLAAKQVLKDVGRVLGEAPGYTAKLANAIPAAPGMTIKKALEESPEFKNLYDADKRAREIIEIGKRLEGNKRHASQHACGLVIAPSVVSDFLPTSMEIDRETEEKGLTSQVVMSEVEELSLIKMDLLGLKTMGVIHEVVDNIQKNRGKKNILKQIGSNRNDVRYQDIPLNDRKVYQMLARGETGAVFQLESPGMTKLIRQMFADIDTLPDDRLDECFERLIAAVALYRPGPMDYIPNYIDGMNDVQNISYPTPELEDILRPTYGVIVYQEQVMQIVQKIAGFSLGRADTVRKAMGKKKRAMMDAEKEVFIFGNKESFESGKDKSFACGCIANGISQTVAEEIWGQMENFASYAFNRSHAACYAYIACITAYMRCYWPEEFYAAMLNAFIDNSDKVKAYLSQASRANIKLLPPHINLSEISFTAQNGKIRFGLGGIKGIKSMAASIMRERSEGGSFKSLSELYNRMAEKNESLNKTAVEGLAYSNALSEFSANKNQILAAFPALEKSFKKTAADRALNQISLFGEINHEIPLPDAPPMSQKRELEKENEVLGVYLSGHPSQILNPILAANKTITTLEDLAAEGEKRSVVTSGMLNDVRVFYTRKEEQMATFYLESQFVSIPCVVFPKDMASCLGEIREGNVAVVTGSYVKKRNEEGLQFVVSSITCAEAFSDMTKPFPVYINNKTEQTAVLKYIKANPGDRKVLLCGSNGRSWELSHGVNLTLKTLNYLSGDFRNDIAAAAAQ